MLKKGRVGRPLKKEPGRTDRHFRDPGEAIALGYLEERGHRLLRHNLHFRFVEVDLVTLGPDGKTLHFVEVKSWSPETPYHPLETQGRRKHLLYRAASLFHAELRQKGWKVAESEFSFDLIWVCDEGVEYYPALYS